MAIRFPSRGPVATIEEVWLVMCSRVVRSVAVAGTLVLMLAGVAWHGWGLTDAQEATPAPSHGQHGHASTEAAERSPYADDFDAEAPIRSLTREEVAQIERGEGAGFASPAELNGVPGPRHVLDLAHELDLSHAQVTQVQAIYDQMQAPVTPVSQR